MSSPPPPLPENPIPSAPAKLQTPGALPRSFLQPGERIYFEGRPSFSGYSWGRFLVYGFFLFVLIVTLLFAPVAMLANGVWWFFFVIFVALAAHRIYVWSRSAFVLTDRRVLSTAGFVSNGLEQASLLQVKNVTVGVGIWRNVTFHIGNPPGVPLTFGMSRKVVWHDVPGAADVANYVGQAISVLLPALLQAQAVQAQAQTEALHFARKLARTIYCPYCGTAIDASTLPKENAACPSCGAPVTPPELLPPPPPPMYSPGVPLA